MVLGRSQRCERIRGSISAELDGELSELESMRVRDHLSRCDSCNAFKADAETLATALRAAPLEPLSRPLSLPSRRRSIMPLRIPVPAAAAAAVMIVSGGLFASLHSSSLIHGSRPAQAAIDNRLDYRAMARRQAAANFANLLALRAQVESNKLPRRPGFQKP